MPYFSERSLRNLNSCDERIKNVLYAAIERFDFTVTDGHRTEEAQNRAYAENNSTLRWPDSKHNKLPSLAVDIAPWPINYNNINSFFYMAVIILEEASRLKVPMRWGGNWKTFKDYPHFELLEE